MSLSSTSAPLLRRYFTKELKDAHLSEVDKIKKLSKANLVERAKEIGLDVEQFKVVPKPKKSEVSVEIPIMEEPVAAKPKAAPKRSKKA
jgi:hypothetical protein